MRAERRLLPAVVVLACALLVPGNGLGQASDPSRPPPDVAGLLEPWAGPWARLDDQARVSLVDNARRWQRLDDEARALVLLRLSEIEALAPAERAQRRARRQAWAAMGAEDRRAILAAARRLEAASDEQRRAWRDAFEAQDVAEQRSWTLGPVTGRSLQELRPLFAFVGEDERQASLALLTQLGADDREALVQLVRRMPQAERESFRRRLLDASPDQRGRLIRERLGD